MLKRPLRDIAALVGASEVSSLDLFNEAHENALAAQTLNIFTARSGSAEPATSGALAGIPYAAKDAIESEGLPTCAASPALRTLNVTRDAAVLECLEKSGAVLIGKTNMHEERKCRHSRHSRATPARRVWRVSPWITIPIGCTSEGLPVGLLIETRARRDRNLLALAGRLEAIAEPQLSR